MNSPRTRWLVAVTLFLTGLSVAPAPPMPAKPSPLAEARYQAALKQFELTWSYFQQARIDSYQVYVWSRLLLDSRRDMGETPNERIAALKGCTKSQDGPIIPA